MSEPRFSLHSSALMGYDLLTNAERETLDAVVAPLLGLPEDRWPSAGAIRLDSPAPLYLLRIDPSLRALVRPGPEGQVEVHDLFRQETAERFSKEAHQLQQRA